MFRSHHLLRVCACLVGAAMLGLAGSAVAQTNWTGSLDSNWSTLANWDNGLPVAGADATINGGVHTPVLDIDAAAANLRLGTTVSSLLGIPNGNILDISGSLYLGGPASTSSTVMQSAGTVNIGGALWLGGTAAGQTGTSQYFLSGAGVLNVAGQIGVGQTGTGLFEQTGGVFNNSGALFIGDAYYGAGATGTYNLSAGTYNGPASPTISAIGVWGGNGTLSISGTGQMNEARLTMGLGLFGNMAGSTSHINLHDNGVLNLSDSLTLAANAATVGTLTQDGGTLTVPTLMKGPGTGVYNLTGGTLNVSAVPDLDLTNNGATVNVGGQGTTTTLLFGDPGDPGGQIVNLARGKSAVQVVDPSWGYPASNGVDGNYNSFTHCDQLSPNNYWEVDLTGGDSNVTVDQIIVHPRNDYSWCATFLSNFYIRLTDKDGVVTSLGPFVTETPLGLGEAFEIPLDGVSYDTRYIKVQLDGFALDGNGYLCLAELEAFGGAPAIPAVYTNYAQNSESTLGIELDPTVSACDKLVAGEVTLAGTLDVTSLGGDFANGQIFDILDWETLSGTFDQLNLPTLTGTLSWDTSALYTTGVLQVVPEPSSMLLLILGLLGFVGVARWR